jgi:hypothetical protein
MAPLRSTLTIRIGICPITRPGVENAVQTYNMFGERLVDSDEIERLIRANVDKTVTVLDADGEIQNLFVHSVDEEGFVCDIAAEMTQPPACAYWVRFTDVREVHPAGDGCPKPSASRCRKALRCSQPSRKRGDDTPRSRVESTQRPDTSFPQARHFGTPS